MAKSTMTALQIVNRLNQIEKEIFVLETGGLYPDRVKWLRDEYERIDALEPSDSIDNTDDDKEDLIML